MEKLATLDYVAIILYLLIMASVGLFFGWFIKDIKGYFKGGNIIPWNISGISNFMGSLSTFVFVAYAGIAYSDGIVGIIVLFCTIPPFIFAALVMGKRWIRSRILTPVEYLETRFNNKIRQLFSWIGLGMRFLDNMVRQYAMGIFLTAATDLSFLEAIVFSGIVTILFTIVGGVWSVVVMDTLQFVILLFASVLLVPLSLEAAGGFYALVEKHPEHFNWFSGPKGQPLWLFIYYLMVLLKYNGNWVFIQRFYSVKDETATKKLGFFSALLMFLFPVIFLLPAIAAVDILPNLDNPEQAYVAVAVHLLPAGLLGLMIAAMFSATMSSLNSEFNVMSAVLTNDIYKRLINPNASGKELISVARINILLVGAIVVLGSFYMGELGGAFEANKLLTGLFAIPTAIPLILGLLFKKTNSTGAFFSVLTGITLGLVFNSLENLSWEMSTFLQIIGCSGVFFVSGLLLSSSKAYIDRVNAFFKKLNTPLSNSEIGKAKPRFQLALANLFAIAIGLSGLLFIGISFPSIDLSSGKIAIVIGLICFFSAVTLRIYAIKNLNVRSHD
ncbi:sodium:solute symporter family transporter [Ulvibacterium sp.]|uniref:sodium:solute symporter family transporter n=1 Tax=Ulvibacterium sp. TaxID=2665914 RepID=UPI003BAD4171